MARPKPTAILELEKGKLYSDQRDRAELEPKSQREIKPRCPARFNSAERKAWKELSTILKNYGLFTVANAVQLELLATAWSQYIECCDQMAKNPNIIITGRDGGAMYNPYFNAQHRLAQLVDRYSQNLGLSSIALAKIGSLLLKKKKEKDADGFFE